MAYATVAVDNTPAATDNVLTVFQEKEFVINEFFNGNHTSFNTVNNSFSQIYENTDALIPLTSVIYTPNKKFFENSKFYKQINNNKILAWLKKHNILVLIYGITSNLDHHQTMTHEDYGHTIMNGNGGSSIFNPNIQNISNIFKSEHNILDTNYDTINLIRFENSGFNYRLNTINERVNSVYSSNFSTINRLIFSDLNNDFCISKFMKNTININLN